MIVDKLEIFQSLNYRQTKVKNGNYIYIKKIEIKR